MFEQIKSTARLLMEAELTPVQGERFQPTGFPDIGAAVYELPNGTRKILVESAQSMANRLEQTILKGGGPEIDPQLEGLPYIVADLKGDNFETITSSLVEAHRINSPFIISDNDFKKKFTDMSGYETNQPINWTNAAKTLFYFDINSLIHGAFMANLGDGRVRFPRALTAFIEASDVKEVEYGGVKFNNFDPSGKIRAANYDKDVYGNVPYHRVEYTAGEIKAFFNIDIALLKGYNLDEDAFNLLIALSLYKIRKFINSGLRLRTACDLIPKGEIKAAQLTGFSIPALEDLLIKIKELTVSCKNKELIADPPVTRISTKTVVKKS